MTVTIGMGRRPRHRVHRRASPRIGVVRKPGSGMLSWGSVVTTLFVALGVAPLIVSGVMDDGVVRQDESVVQERSMLREAGGMVVRCPALRGVGRVVVADGVIDVGEFEALKVVAKRRCPKG
jgi:hypothetical protein